MTCYLLISRLRLSISFFFSFVLILPMYSNAFAKNYKIQLDRPYKINQKYTLHSTIHLYYLRQLVRKSEKTKHIKNVYVHYQAVVRILALDKNSQPTKKEHHIVQFSLMQKDKRKPLLPKGSKLVASIQNGQKHFHSPGHKLSVLSKRILRLLIWLKLPDIALHDNIIGTSKMVKIGEKWQVDKQQFLSQTHRKSRWLRLNRKTFTGYSKLLQISNVRGKSCLHVGTYLTDNHAKKLMRLPKNLKATTQKWNLVLDGHFPMDNSLPWIQGRKVLRILITAKNSTGTPTSLKVERRYTISNSRTFIK